MPKTDKMNRSQEMQALLEMDQEDRQERVREMHLVAFEKRLIPALEKQAKELKHALKMYKKDPGKYRPQLDNMEDAMNQLGSLHRVMERRLNKLRYGS